ncbi:unnamed protein product [Brassica oleracea]|uniref:(rape) hypothetical protein n=1 Tax=Brassica napus TaxID=3708 RepID=A0A816I6D0_BRANA|nr:unnamed protein product [Brassica napus]
MLHHAIETNVQIFTKLLSVSASAVGISHARKLPISKLATILTLFLYTEILRRTRVSDNFTFTTLTKACTLSMCVVDQGLQLHSQIWRYGFCADISKNIVIYKAMMDGCVKSGDMTSARRLFDEMSNKTVITWTTMIHGYCNNKEVDSARELFDAMPERNFVSSNTMMSGYCQNKQTQEAIRLFQEMQATTSLDPDDVAILSLLPAISDTGALVLGEWCHRFVQRRKLDKKVKVCTGVLDMYTKCGEVEEAEKNVR